MLQIRRIMLRGLGVEDASISFVDGANVLAGESDTGKSYLLRCLDYIFGAEAMKKRIPQAEPYSQLLVEFQNTEKQYLTLTRSLSGGDLAAYYSSIDQVEGDGTKIAARRSGKSIVPDVTSILFPFAGMSPDVKLRKNDLGEVQRLSIRTLMSVVLIDEVAVIDERSPVIGDASFDATARQRMFSYMLSGKDDQGIIVAEKKAIVSARNSAQLGLIADLLEPLEKRLQQQPADDPDSSIEKVDRAITALSLTLTESTHERADLMSQLQEATTKLQKAESQGLAVAELLSRYHLLDGRYGSDLERLDFVAEGAHYFEGLQQVLCPLCDQQMTADHVHTAHEARQDIYQGAKAEAAKILTLRADLGEAIDALETRQVRHSEDKNEADSLIRRIESRLQKVLSPVLLDATVRLEQLISRRVELESARNDRDHVASLRTIKEEIEQSANASKGKPKEWEPLPSKSLRMLCAEIEDVLKDWKWKGDGLVEFDQKAFDIVIDGQARQSHGKGVRAILFSAFVVGLLRFCQNNKKPHLGFVMIDSPITSYKKNQTGTDGAVDAGIESAFWESLATLGPDIQLIIIENKEPPKSVARNVNYQWFAGDDALPEQRKGFIPS